MCSRMIARMSGCFSISRMRLAATVLRLFPYKPNGINPFSIISIASIGSLIENCSVSPAICLMALQCNCNVNTLLYVSTGKANRLTKWILLQ